MHKLDDEKCLNDSKCLGVLLTGETQQDRDGTAAEHTSLTARMTDVFPNICH
jgi:hypothetical protein